MYRCTWLVRRLVAAACCLTALVLVMRPWHGDSAAQETPATSGRQSTKVLPPAANLRIRVGTSPAGADVLLDAAAGDWDQTAPTAVLLNRTPRLYQTEPILDRPIPACQVRALRTGDKLVLRLQWADATHNAPAAPPAWTGAGGDPRLLYKRPTAETAAFADAAAVMVPEAWTGPAFPSLLMGDPNAPANIAYWSAGRGARVLTATGRATPQPTGQTIPHRARHENGQWVLTLELADRPAGYPIAFAVWDGAFADRDGLKCFSVWHVLARSD